MVKTLAFVCIVATFAASIALAAPAINIVGWTYISAYGGQVPWLVKHGQAKVVVTEKNISIDASYDGGLVRERIVGRRQGSKLTVTRTIVPSDASPNIMQGTYTRHIDRSTIYEVITLQDPYSIVGVNRISRAP